MNQTQICPNPNCQTPNSSESLFCQACGERLKPGEGQTEFRGIHQPVNQQPPGGSAGFRDTSSGSHRGRTYFSPIPLDKLGARLDGWAELIEGAADKKEPIARAFEEEYQQKQVPQVNLTLSQLTPGGMVGKRRYYHLFQSYTGATMAAYIGEFGKDLYVTWELFVRPIIKWRNIAYMAGIAGLLGLCPALVGQNILEEPLLTLILWLFSIIGWFLPVAVVALIAGRVMKGSFLAFFIEEIDLFAADDVTAMMFAVHKSLLKALDSAGLDTTLLRSKDQFTAGRRERLI
jgi:hypothetical protein